jgi:hypothetical protein
MMVAFLRDVFKTSFCNKRPRRSIYIVNYALRVFVGVDADRRGGRGPRLGAAARDA